MDADRAKKWTNYRALYQLEEKARNSRDRLALMKAKYAELQELEGKGQEQRFCTFDAYLKDLVQRKPTWFTPQMIEKAYDRRVEERRKVEVEEQIPF